MVGVRSIIKLFVPLLLMATIMFASAEARRAYQTIENQDVIETAVAVEDPLDIAIPVKRQAQPKQDKQAHQTSIKVLSEKREQPVKPIRSDQFLSTPLDCMIQFEKENHAGLESQSASTSKQTTAELATPSRAPNRNRHEA
jgi:hypothetical protein